LIGAPERHPGSHGFLGPVFQTVDIWSLGCCFSLAATWIVLGYSGVQKFHRFRESAIQALRKKSKSSETPSSLNGKDARSCFVALSAGDYFHDGMSVLPAVTAWHKLLRSVARKSDTLSSRVLDLVDREMLLGDAQKRISARELCTELGRIRRESQQDNRSLVPEATLADILLEVD
jgi:serine/threonine protein kinase